MQMYYVPRFSSIFSLAALLGAAWFSIHLAVADANFREHTPESVARAVELEPHNADYLAVRALQLDYDGADSTAVLQQEAALSPMSSAPRIRLGLAAEIRGENATAERWLLEAASIDRQYEPRWTLANFYFRQQREDQFWKSMREALEISYGDRRPAFDLCWRMGDAATILTRAIPEKRDVIAQYLWYVLESHRDAIAPAAMKLAALDQVEDRPQILAATDALIEASDAQAARALWQTISVIKPEGIINGDFGSEPLQHGFDWRWSYIPGIVNIPFDQHPTSWLRIAFDGREPESATLLTQIVNLTPRQRYRLSWQARPNGLGTPSGIEWNIAGQHAEISERDLRFTAAGDLAPLTLTYRRPAGQARAEGSIEISRVALTTF